jgi:hypothetical protein
MAATAFAAVVAPAGLEQINRQQCTYTACYCEENVYHLLQHLIESGNKQAGCLFAVFISNSNETVSGPVQQCCIERDDSSQCIQSHVRLQAADNQGVPQGLCSLCCECIQPARHCNRLFTLLV